MVYIKTTWRETGMTTSQKVAALNNLETQYDEMITAFNAHTHDDRYYTKSVCDSKYFNSSNDGAGSGFVAEYLDGYTAAQILSGAIPSGVIAIWSGSVASIPAGWQICNGTNGTPDLRDRFVVGAGGSLSRGATGGSNSVTPTVPAFNPPGHALTAAELPAHTHTYTELSNLSGSVGGPFSSMYQNTTTTRTTKSTSGYTGAATEHYHNNSTVTLNAIDMRPPYYALCYIMKL